MKTIKTFPQAFTEIENCWIPLSDGCRLAGKIWMPNSAVSQPVPAILEYLPYRKRDGTHERDALTYPYYAGHGYAGVRVDMRGNGDSDGLMFDEYLKQEQDDALEVIQWLCDQSWCNGNIGMMGISWGGFNALQVAARKPDALKAIISLCSTDNRYTDDIHYKGGALLMENLGWASTMFSYSSRPPDAQLRPDDWKEIWINRLNNTPLLIEKWLKHPFHDAQWKHGSIDENYADIEAATLLVGGWHDAYSNTIPRMLAHLACPKQGIIGPWAHKYPHFAVPGPQMGFLQESRAWWDYWLKGIDNGVMNNPLYRAYLMDSVPPKPNYTHRAGRWIAENHWPSQNVNMTRLYLGPKGLGRSMENRGHTRIQSPQDTGIHGGAYCIMWLGPDWPTDQSDDDAKSLIFDTQVLTDPLSLFGAPIVTLAIRANTATGNIVVRLCDVAPGGESTLITYGVLNLACRNGYESPEPLACESVMTISIQLDDCGYTVARGHQIRLAVATAHWPMIWPSADAMMLTVDYSDSFVQLPVYDDPSSKCPELPEAMVCEPYPQTILQSPKSHRKVTRDNDSNTTQVDILNDFGKQKSHVHGLIKHEINHECHQINPDDPNSARSLITGMQYLERDDWKIQTETRTEMRCSHEHFHIKASLKAFESDKLVFERDWDTLIDRK